MKRNLMTLVVAVLVVMFVGTIVSSASAADMMAGLNNSINFPGFNFGYNTDSYADNSARVYFSGWLANSDRIDYVGVSVSRSTDSGNYGWVSMNWGGSISAATALKQNSSSTTLNRHGVYVFETVNVSSYKEVVGWSELDQPIYGNLLDSGNASVILEGVIPLYANAYYNEYNTSGKDGDGMVIGNTNWNAYIQWYCYFDNISLPLTSISLASAPASVPEPASLGLLALSGLGLLIRRR